MADRIRLAELTAGLSIATDLAMGQPIEWALASCLLAVRLGEAAGANDSELREIYFQAMLRYIGCNAESYQIAALVGDEIVLRSDVATVDLGSNAQVFGMLLRAMRSANAGKPTLQFIRSLAAGLVTAPELFRENFAGHCEVAQRLAVRLGFSGGIVGALGQLYERWDGRGMPNGLKGEQIALSVRVVSLAQDVITFLRIGGPEAAVETVRERRARAYDPRLAERFLANAPALLTGLDHSPSWDDVIAAEPGQPGSLNGDQLDAAFEAMADFADLKSPFLLGHSPRVAALAAGAARRAGLPKEDEQRLRSAGLLHDLGRTGISAGVWGKPGPLTEREWEQVRLHPYYTERILARPATLARIGALAGGHHERLDGSGYHRASSGASLSIPARLLSAADIFCALQEPRPHRPARSADEAVGELQREVRAGKIDADAAEAVLDTAGHSAGRQRKTLAAGLTSREIDVLRQLARGKTTREIATDLVITPKTADNHIQHIYSKIGVSTRAGATLFALEHDLHER